MIVTALPLMLYCFIIASHKVITLILGSYETANVFHITLIKKQRGYLTPAGVADKSNKAALAELLFALLDLPCV